MRIKNKKLVSEQRGTGFRGKIEKRKDCRRNKGLQESTPQYEKQKGVLTERKIKRPLARRPKREGSADEEELTQSAVTLLERKGRAERKNSACGGENRGTRKRKKQGQKSCGPVRIRSDMIAVGEKRKVTKIGRKKKLLRLTIRKTK